MRQTTSIRRIAFAVVVLAVVACGGSSITATRPDNVQAESGTYSLTLVPIGTTATTSLLSGTAKINADYTYSITLNFKNAPTGQPATVNSTAENGTFTLHNSALTLKPMGTAPAYVAGIGDGVLVYIEPTLQKQLKFVR